MGRPGGPRPGLLAKLARTYGSGAPDSSVAAGKAAYEAANPATASAATGSGAGWSRRPGVFASGKLAPQVRDLSIGTKGTMGKKFVDASAPLPKPAPRSTGVQAPQEGELNYSAARPEKDPLGVWNRSKQAGFVHVSKLAPNQRFVASNKEDENGRSLPPVKAGPSVQKTDLSKLSHQEKMKRLGAYDEGGR